MSKVSYTQYTWETGELFTSEGANNLETGIAACADAINDNIDTLADQAEAIEANETAIANNAADIATNATNIAGLQSDASELAEQVDNIVMGIPVKDEDESSEYVATLIVRDGAPILSYYEKTE